MFIDAAPVTAAVAATHELAIQAVATPPVACELSGAPNTAIHDERTRDRVLRHVSESGPVTAAAVAAELGLTATAIRRHLDLLVGSGDIAVAALSGPPRGRGRPARAFVVTSAGHRRLSSHYDDLAASAVRYLAEHFGDEAVERFARDRIGVLEQRYRDQVAALGSDPRPRAHALAAALAQDGFAATARQVGPADAPAGIQLCQGHCPMHQVAVEFPQFCEAETDAFARLLGVHVQRLATLAHGEHVCTTFIPLTSATGRSGLDHEGNGP